MTANKHYLKMAHYLDEKVWMLISWLLMDPHCFIKKLCSILKKLFSQCAYLERIWYNEFQIPELFLRPNYFIFIGYLKMGEGEGVLSNPLKPPLDPPLVYENIQHVNG